MTKWGKVLISLNPFCQRSLVWGGLQLAHASASAFLCTNPFPHACFLLRARTIFYDIPPARVLKLVSASRQPFSIQALLLRWGFLLRARAENPGRTPTRTRRMFCGRPLCLRSIHKTSGSERKSIYMKMSFQLPRERRNKRADVEIFRPFLAKFTPARAAQKSRTARSCAYKKLNYRI